jgi:hypothetical protein
MDPVGLMGAVGVTTVAVKASGCSISVAMAMETRQGRTTVRGRESRGGVFALLECRRFLSVRISLPIRRVAIAQPSEPPRDVRGCM